jgi:uncharacterized membrane protein
LGFSMNLTKEEREMIAYLRHFNPANQLPNNEKTSFGERVADSVVKRVGSWRFLIIQSVILVGWVILNVVAYIQHWDPYPFILLNLVLSFQAAYTAPVILMSQNREASIDRAKLDYFYNVNLKQELEIELLHEKIDYLTEKLLEPSNVASK